MPASERYSVDTMGRTIQLENCRSCGYPVPPGARCPECEVVQSPVEIGTGALREDKIGLDAKLILITGMIAPLGLTTILAMFFVSYITYQSLPAVRLAVFVCAGVPPLALFVRVPALRNLALMPWWMHAMTAAAVGMAGYGAMMAFVYGQSARYTGYGHTGYGVSSPYTIDEFYFADFAPFVVLPIFGFLLLLPALEQARLARIFGLGAERSRTRNGVLIAALWPASYLLAAPAVGVVDGDADGLVYLFLTWLGLGLIIGILQVLNGRVLLRCAAFARLKPIDD